MENQRYKPVTKVAVQQHLTAKASDTLLWVALVCQDLRITKERHVLKKLALFPPGLDALYTRMMQQINESNNAENCRCILASAAILYRPVIISELIALIEQLQDVSDDVQELVRLCILFLLFATTQSILCISAQRISSLPSRLARSSQKVPKMSIG